MVLVHGIVVVFGGPHLFGARPGALFPFSGSAIGDGIVPGIIGFLGCAIGWRLLRVERSEKHGHHDTAA